MTTDPSALEARVSAHYADANLLDRVLDAARASGLDLDRLTTAELAPFDEFHVGGVAATERLAGQLAVAPGTRLLDIGSGLGGPARWFAQHFDAHVEGIDLTAEFVTVAGQLSERVGLADRTTFTVGSALAMPYTDGQFDGATLLHVGMNIADKATLFTEAARVVRPGGFLAVYEVMRTGSAELTYPLPWAAAPDFSFVESPATYRDLITRAGFAVEVETDRRSEAADFFAQQVSGGGPPRGLGQVAGPALADRLANLAGQMRAGVLAPTELICRRSGG